MRRTKLTNIALALMAALMTQAAVHCAPAEGVEKRVAAARPGRLGSIDMPRWSPDGAKAAFVYSIGGGSDVYIVNADGTGLMNISRNPRRDTNPVWSPDGAWLLFTSNREGQFDICKADRDGGQVECWQNPGDDMWPTWSPDGATIAYCNYATSSPIVYLMDSGGNNREQFYDKRACYPAFSADGKMLALVSSGDLLVFELKNRKSKNVTKPLLEGWMVEDTMPVWAPRGNRIAFIGRFEGYSSELYTIGSDGSKVRRISETLYENFLPAWEPKGKGIIYSAYVSGRLPEIFVSDPESPVKKRLTNNYIIEMNPQYSPDGTKILFTARKGSNTDLYIMDAEGKTEPERFLKEGLPTVEQARKKIEEARKRRAAGK
jgi:Tol biopolymer transport system component